jgi:DNA-binding response OmpR family regulator
MDIFTQVLTGFGAKRLLRTGEYEEAQRLTRQQPVDLIICEGGPLISQEGLEGYDFVRWLRRSGLEPNAFVPVMLATAHSGATAVARARDCGAHFIVKKPLVPGVLLDRILWIARANRPFVNCAAYVGPDRRFKNQGSPTGVGRRATDLSAEVGLAKDPNMSQDEIDNLMQPQRVAL